MAANQASTLAWVGKCTPADKQFRLRNSVSSFESRAEHGLDPPSTQRASRATTSKVKSWAAVKD
jgi:hypothetical protein